MDRIIIEMDGTPRPFHFGVGFIGAVLDAMKIGFDQFQTEVDRNPFTSIPLMMYESHKLACYMDDVPCKITRGDVIKWIDKTGGIGGEPVQTFLEAWRTSQTKDAPEKKKRPATKKTPAKN